MSKVVALVVALACTSAVAADDPWFGSDKALHFGATFGIAALGYGSSRALLHLSPEASVGAGVSLSLAVGVVKELVDLRHGDSSLRDVVFDVLGAATGAAFGVFAEWLWHRWVPSLATR